MSLESEENTAFRPRGYIREQFRIFHLSGAPEQEIPLHYHDFCKLVILTGGEIGYEVEGRRYPAEAGDIIVVPAGTLHRPVLFAPSGEKYPRYERVIIYFHEDFFAGHEGAGLKACFEKAKATGCYLLDRSRTGQRELLRKVPGFYEPSGVEGSAGELLRLCRLTEFLLLLNTLSDHREPKADEERNPLTGQVLGYLDAHFREPLTVGAIAEALHLSASYLMHAFRAASGTSVMAALEEKRLFCAQALLSSGTPAAEACFASGFTNYSSFFRAYKRRYGTSPNRRSAGHLPAAGGEE